ncbi:MAG: GNAT family N-acetyltransferase [Faecousia sp.]
MTARFRSAVQSDLEAVNVLAGQVLAMHAAWRPDIFIPLDNPLTAENFQVLVNEQRVFVLAEDSRVIAYAIVAVQTLRSPVLIPKTVMKLEELCVAEDRRHQGVGKTMMGHLFREAKRRGCNDFTLTCYPQNAAAIALYESLGMKPKVTQYQIDL